MSLKLDLLVFLHTNVEILNDRLALTITTPAHPHHNPKQNKNKTIPPGNFGVKSAVESSVRSYLHKFYGN